MERMSIQKVDKKKIKKKEYFYLKAFEDYSYISVRTTENKMTNGERYFMFLINAKEGFEGTQNSLQKGKERINQEHTS